MSDASLRKIFTRTDPLATCLHVSTTRGGTAVFAPPPGPRYDLQEEIARGGMGVVYRAIDRWLEREVAVKVLLDKFASDSEAADRFGHEASLTGQLQHPSIPPVHDVGTLPNGRPFIAMKLVKGHTLEVLLASRPDLWADRGRFMGVFEQVCQAVAYAHTRGVIHRDLKPGNVMVGAFGEVQVMDWGLAKVLTDRKPEQSEEHETVMTAVTDVLNRRYTDDALTQAGSVLGTLAFIPPEQAAGSVKQVNARSDVFGLGAVLAVILTGQPPFVAASAEATLGLAARGWVGDCLARLDGCGADPQLVELCKSCLAPKQEGRPADAGKVAWAVAALMAEAAGQVWSPGRVIASGLLSLLGLATGS